MEVASSRDTNVPRIAVVIPCFNDGATVGETVDSAMQQERCEIVVVDDGSTDPDTQRVCEELRSRGVSVIRQENKGLSAARMAGVAATAARYVYPLDSDDYVLPNSLGSLADALDSAPANIAAAWGIGSAFGDVDVVYRQKVTTIDPWRVTHSAGLGYAAMFRREALLAVGGWNLRGPYEDWDLWMALAERGYGGLHVPVMTLRYRVHGNRMWAAALRRHDDIVNDLKFRHPGLYSQRHSAWRRSSEPWAVRLLFPLIGALPMSAPTRQRSYMAVEDPRRALRLATLKLRRMAR